MQAHPSLFLSATLKHVVIIGGGPAGYPCAIRLAQYGFSVTLVEAQALGGTCLNWGCIPSKSLIHLASVYKDASSNAHLTSGISIPSVELDWPVMQANIQHQVVGLRKGVEQRLNSLGIKVIQGKGRFISPSHIEVKTLDGELKTLEPDAVVVATGAATFIPDSLQFCLKEEVQDCIVYINRFFDMTELPKRLGIIGAGVIGLEIAQAMSRLGVEVTIFERAKDILPAFEKRFVKTIQKELEADGVKFEFGVDLLNLTPTESSYALSYKTLGDDVAEPTTCLVDKLLVVPGRKANTQNLNLEAAGVLTDDRSDGILTNERLQSNQPHIFAIGDVGHAHVQLAHVATHHGLLVADMLAGKRSGLDALTRIPSVVYTQPELASVGMSLSYAKEIGLNAKQTVLPFAALGRALVENATQGQALIVVDEDSRAVLGAQVMGPHADILITQMIQAIELGATVEDVALTIHPHPSLSEAWLEVAERHLGHGIHID